MTGIVVFDIDGVIRDVTNSYRRALADTVEHFTEGAHRPSMEEIDNLKAEGIWNNDWEGSQELVYRYYQNQNKKPPEINYEEVVNFFQRRYRGENLDNPQQWDGYITQEPLLVNREFFAKLDESSYYWGFFSGATNGSAHYVLNTRLGLNNPPLVAMDDAPGKPDPTGLFLVVQMIQTKYQLDSSLPIIYLGDTVADMMTVTKAKEIESQREITAIGVLPSHVKDNGIRQDNYTRQLQRGGALKVLSQVTDFL
ncbi:MAG: TIGR01548 family HAD-type hydrolase [Cyanobacterium sp. T60_A2020_053]|nr:TIGR01548 family HAD-type hydrolase [Cyanobacterium sp. T60_A2020_053]